MRLNAYFRRDAKLSHLRTKDGAEINLLIEFPRKHPLCIEIKSAPATPLTEISKLRRITESVPTGVPIIVYNGVHERSKADVRKFHG